MKKIILFALIFSLKWFCHCSYQRYQSIHSPVPKNVIGKENIIQSALNMFDFIHHGFKHKTNKLSKHRFDKYSIFQFSIDLFSL